MQKNRKRSRKRMIYAILFSLILTVILMLFGWRYYIRKIEDREWKDSIEGKKYERHYVMIQKEESGQLWQEVLAVAKQTARENEAFLESFGNWTEGDYQAADYIRIAAAAKVDGILVCPDGTAKMRKAIDAAEDDGIPVITLMEDDAASSRKSFVGFNSYQLGTVYGNQIAQCLDDSTRKILVLQNRKSSEKNLVFKQMKTTVQEAMTPRQKEEITIESRVLLSENTFDTEEIIRDLMKDEEQRPDILVCMSESESECAYHAMIDYNQVGKVKLIGYYDSETMKSAVSKQIVSSVITPDLEQLGSLGIEALEEYYSMGYVSSFFSVDLHVLEEADAGM